VTIALSGTGIWSAALRYGDAAEAADAAAELEGLGYSAVWLPDVGGDLFAAVGNLLGATARIPVATGILNLWLHTPAETAAAYAALVAEHGRRFVVGIGVSHAPLVERVREPGAYTKPLAMTRDFLSALDAEEPPLPAADRLLAALGPRMLELARTRAAGVHPYLGTPEHTAIARAAVGDGRIVAPEQGVVLETDPERARALARTHLDRYLTLPNYTNNWGRLGFTDDDLTGGGSNRLVDALVAWGDEKSLAARVQEHRDAGADHVCVQVLTDDSRRFVREQWSELAPALT
jgi:probable F420-dependent oxidoreductase